MTHEDFASIIIGTITHDFLRYILGAGGVYLVINVALAGPLRNRKIRPDSPGWPQLRREIAVSMRTVMIFAANGVVIASGAALDLLPIYDDIDAHGWTWLVFSTGLVVVAHDAWFYWSHRLIHHPRLFRHLHRLHHRSRNPSPFAAYSFDTGEAVINAIFLPLFVALVPMHPMALLIFVVVMMLRNALGHCGFELYPADAAGRPLFGWLAGVTHHDQHHRDARYNMGLYFTWWDRWMGTEHPQYRAEFARAAPRLRVGRKGLTGSLLLAVLIAVAGAETRAEPLSGTYAAPGLYMVVRFGPCPREPVHSCGWLVWGWSQKDWTQARPGDLVVSGLEPRRAGWAGGRLIDPGSGRVYRGTARRRGDGTLAVRGCAGPFCASQVWHPLGPLLSDLETLRSR